MVVVDEDQYLWIMDNTKFLKKWGTKYYTVKCQAYSILVILWENIYWLYIVRLRWYVRLLQ